MKKIYFVLAFVLLGAAVKAQPVITSANYPSAGESYTGYFIFSNAPYNPGPDGANQTWDFSNLAGYNNTPFNYMNPSTTPYSATFGSADVALNALTQYNFLESNASRVQIVGSVVSTATTTVIPLSDPQKVIDFPFTYQDSFKDTAVSLTYPLANGNNQRRRISSKSIADAYGTIILPNPAGGSLTFNNVLRLLVTSYTVDSTFNSSNVFVKRDISIDTNYYWISENFKPHVFVLNRSKQNSNPSTTTAVFFANPGVPTGIAKGYDSYFSIFPNPMSTELKIEIDEQLFKTAPSLRISILNSTGKEMANYPIESTLTKISRGNLTSGIYIYKIYNKEEIVNTGKLTVQ